MVIWADTAQAGQDHRPGQRQFHPEKRVEAAHADAAGSADNVGVHLG